MLPSKWENLSRCSTKLIHVWKKTTTCIGLQAQQIFSVNILYTYFSILGVAFAVSFLCYFQKLQLLVVKIFWANFCCIVLLYFWDQKVYLRFLKPYFKLEILVFSPFLVSFLVDMFSDKKIISGEIWNTLVEKLLRINVAKYQGKVPSLAEVGALQSYS